MITAKDIQEQAFEHARKGYDIEEVDVFLERVATDVDALTRQNADLRAQISELQAALEEAEAAAEAAAEAVAAPVPAAAPVAEAGTSSVQVRDLEDRIATLERENSQLEARLAEKNDDAAAISAAFIAAQKSADAMKEEARVEGERIYREAETKAREIVRDALADKQQTLTEIERLKKSRDDFQSEYQDLLGRFAAEADAQFKALRTNGPVDETELAAEEKVAFSELRRAAANPQQQIPVSYNGYNGAPAAEDNNIPAASGAVADMASFGDTTEIDIDEID